MSLSQGSAVTLSDSRELRLILIGEREAGKSTAGNAILGQQAFDAVGVRTRVSVRKQAVVQGRPLALVDTPGWEWFSSRGAPASSSAARKEMVSGSAELCRPGAHGLLLVVPLAYAFRERERLVAEEHVAMFGQRAWRHTLVLFTIFDRRRLRDCSLEEEVEENEELHALVEKCGGRYQGLFARHRRGEDQVAELLGKIQAMVEGNGGALLPSQEILLEGRKREEEEGQREEKDRMDRQTELRRMKEALSKLEEEEDADDEYNEVEEEMTVDEEAEVTSQRRWRTAERQPERQLSEEGEAKRKSATTFDLNMSSLRSSMRQSCKTQ